MTAVEQLERALGVIARLEPQVQAWAHLDAKGAMEQARSLDARGPGARALPLFGEPVGLKDIVDTADMPTENGTVLHAGRRPAKDAELVRQLRAAGAVIVGKTVTTELATYAPGKTRNPHNLAHSPGGSSSGSAAAVACGMVPLAVGSQTNGSTVRPASFCGVVGFKPGRDRISRLGVLVQSPTFDTVGLFAMDVRGVERLYEALRQDEQLVAKDVRLATERGGNVQGEAAVVHADKIAEDQPHTVVWWNSPWWPRVDPEAQSVLLKAANSMGALNASALADFEARIPTDSIIETHRLIMEAEIARSFQAEFDRGREKLSASLQGQITRGRATSDAKLNEAKEQLRQLQSQADAAWPPSIDVIAMPAALGPAPLGLESTGDPIMCTLGTALDLPAINVPGLRIANGLPIGVQLVGRRGQESRLLQAARVWETGLRGL